MHFVGRFNLLAISETNEKKKNNCLPNFRQRKSFDLDELKIHAQTDWFRFSYEKPFRLDEYLLFRRNEKFNHHMAHSLRRGVSY